MCERVHNTDRERQLEKGEGGPAQTGMLAVCARHDGICHQVLPILAHTRYDFIEGNWSIFRPGFCFVGFLFSETHWKKGLYMAKKLA